MLYIGHFSFDKQPDSNQELSMPSYGYFTLVAEAASMEVAAAKFEQLIIDLANDDDVFDGIDHFYLDACVECKDMPTAGFLAYYSSTTGQEYGTTSTAVRGANDQQVSLYGWGAASNSDDEEHEITPFLSLEK